MTITIRLLSLLGLLLTFSVAGLAQSDPRFIPFTPRPVKGALYSPDSGPAPHIAILAIHRTSNYMDYHGCRELSARGYLVLCMNPRSDNNEARVIWEQNALDVKSGIEFLREQPGITTVLLWGFSGGGGTTSFYQAVAEQGISFCQDERKLSQCGDELEGLPPADGLILVDTNLGIAAGALNRINPSVTNDVEIFASNAAPEFDSSLDPFNPANGYNPNGASSYSEAFRTRYFAAQARRMNTLIEIAEEKLEQIESGNSLYTDDAPFIIHKAESAELMRLDPGIHHTTMQPRRLLQNDGTIVTRIIESVRLPQPELAQENSTFADGVLFLTVRSFLSSNAMRARDSMEDIDYCSSNNSTRCAVQQISVPLLIASMQANRYLQYSEQHFAAAASEDKDLIYIEGAVHGHVPCTACETFPGQYSNVVLNFFDYSRDWIDARY
tara:strand:+ start:209241 stop:210560 length:1320 start_codon:yes stop_codon:yes gene_type:complete